MFPVPPYCGPFLRLQAVVAHPDDETFGCGSLLLRAWSAGATTSVVCATAGQAGEVTPGVTVPGEGLGALREAELREAARLMGVRHVRLLGFDDSGMDGDPPPGSLMAAPFEEVVATVAAAVDEFSPTCLLTLDASDGHRDHARIREATAAVAAERGLRVWLQCIPRSFMRRWAEHMSTVDPTSPYLHLGELGTPDEQVTTVLDSHEFYELRWQAIRAHRSQTSPFEGLPEELERDILEHDHLMRAIPRQSSPSNAAG